MDCIFCKIANKEIPSKIIYEDEKMLVFEDLNPGAPVHVLLIPKDHIPSLDYMEEDHIELMGHILNKVKDIAKLKGLENGYRLVNNCGVQGGQTVDHIHYHLLGGRDLQWPPG